MSLSLSKLRQSSVASLLLAGLGLFIIVITLWLPFGFYSGDILEHWHIRGMLDLRTTNFGVSGAFLDDLALTRPMARILFWIAYYISPDNFLGDNLLLIGLLWFKGMALLGVILRLFPRQYLLAFLIASVAILYPIDTGVISLRIPHVHFGISAYFFALYCLLSYWQTNKSRYLYMAAVSLAFCCLGYEIFYPLIFVSPLLLFLQDRRISMRLIKVSIAWFIAPFITVCYSILVIFGLNFGFQASKIQNGLGLGDILERFLSPYNNTLFQIWNFSELRFDSQWLAIVVTSSSLFFIIAGLIYLLNSKSQRILSRWEFIFFLLGSLALIGLGFIVLIPTDRAVDHLNYRVFLTSSIGAAAFFLAVLYQVTGLSLQKWGFLLLNLLISTFIALSLNFHLNLHKLYVDKLYLQGQFYQQIIETLPVLPQNPTLVIIPEDESVRYEPGVSLRPHILTPTLQYFYGNTQTIRLAFLCGDYRTECRVREDRIVALFEGTRVDFSPEEIVIYLLHRDGSLELMYTYPGLVGYEIDPSSERIPLPARFSSIFRP